MQNKEHLAAAVLLNQLPVHERIQALLSAEHAALLQAEQAKSHPLTLDKFTAAELSDLKAHILDGGGVNDSKQLCVDFINALHDEAWAEFLRLLPHVIKSWIKEKGLVVPTKPGEGVMFSGTGPTREPLIKGDPDVGA